MKTVLTFLFTHWVLTCIGAVLLFGMGAIVYAVVTAGPVFDEQDDGETFKGER